MDVAEFDKNKYLSLATYRKSGVLVLTPVWFAASGGKLYVFSEAKAGKVKRLRNSPRARIAPCDVRGNLRGEWRDTEARIVTDTVLIETALRAFRVKYGILMAATNLLARLAGRLPTRAYIEVDFATGASK